MNKYDRMFAFNHRSRERKEKKVKVKSPSHVQLSVTPWTVVRLLCPPLPEFSQIQVHRISDAIQPSHPLSHPSPPDFNLSQHQGLFQ